MFPPASARWQAEHIEPNVAWPWAAAGVGTVASRAHRAERGLAESVLGRVGREGQQAAFGDPAQRVLAGQHRVGDGHVAPVRRETAGPDSDPRDVEQIQRRVGDAGPEDGQPPPGHWIVVLPNAVVVVLQQPVLVAIGGHGLRPLRGLTGCSSSSGIRAASSYSRLREGESTRIATATKTMT